MAKSSSPKNLGLTQKEAQKLLKQYGYNEFKAKKEYTALKIIASQFTSFLIIILIIAGSISLALHETIDGLAIFAIVILNAFIGFIQEYKAENAVKALKKMVVNKTIVVRDGLQQEIMVRDLVPGDYVILSEGDKIPADIQLTLAASLRVDEATLTGESEPVLKEAGEENIIYKGTIITAGRCEGIVQKTGEKTEFGKIVNLVRKHTKTRSPLAIQLDNLGKKLGIIILALVILIFILGSLRDISALEMLMTSVALGVSAIPEGMPIIVTLTLASGVQILARKKAIVRKMNSIEALGATTIICSDKTGTLTLNEMTVKKVFAGLKESEIPGQGYLVTKKIKLTSPEEKKLLEICENCNHSSIGKDILGDPTEIALKILTRKANYTKEYKLIEEEVFTSDRKMMSTLHKVGKKHITMTKGAFEEVLKISTHILIDGKVRKITKKDTELITEKAIQYSAQALRVLGFAYQENDGKLEEKNMIFTGLVGMMDPPRKSVKKSILTAQKAGIKVKIITGDNAITAKAIGEKIGLNINNVATGQEIEKLSDKELTKLINKTEIFARTKPKHKYRIVDLLKKQGEIVAVTGDGVNDAPALKHSDVGIAMGIKGTEATKEVADIILKDDNFTTIVNTIEEGRRIYHNILAFIKYMLSANFDTIMAVGLLTVAGYPLPILPLQVLWINLATDALPALALGKSPASPGIMKEKPHPNKESIFKKFLFFIISAVILQTIVNIVVFSYGYHLDLQMNIDLKDLSLPTHSRTMVFTQIVLFELLFVFVCKEEKFSIKSILANKALIGAVGFSFVLQLIMIYTPWMQEVFKTVDLTLPEWGILLLGSSTAFLVPALSKALKSLFKKP